MEETRSKLGFLETRSKLGFLETRSKLGFFYCCTVKAPVDAYLYRWVVETYLRHVGFGNALHPSCDFIEAVAPFPAKTTLFSALGLVLGGLMLRRLYCRPSLRCQQWFSV